MNIWVKAWSIVLAVGLLLPAAAIAQRFEVESSEQLVAGRPIQIKLTGLPPNAEVEVEAQRVLVNEWERGAPVRTYRSQARFRADAQGTVDLHDSPSLGGSFTGADPSGLFWSMQPVDDSPAAQATDEVTLTARIDGRSVAHSSFRLPDRMPGFSVQEVAGFPGSYFAPYPSRGRHPVIVVAGGTDDNSFHRNVLMPRLAAHGFSVFYLATYSLVYGPGRPSVEGLPTRYVNIPVDRLQAVRDWLARRADVDPGRIGLYGNSRNGAYVLIAATRFPWVRAVAGIVPSDVVWEGWGDQVKLGTTSSYSWGGKPLPFVPYDEGFLRESAKIARGQPFRLRTPMDQGRRDNPDRVPAARIKLETYRGPLFLAGGEQDNLWASGQMVQNISERRAEAGLDTTVLIFPDAGHSLGGDGWSPTMLFESGDARAAEARAHNRTWESMVDFFTRSLQPGRSR